MNGPTKELQSQVATGAADSGDLGHLSVGNVPQRPSTSTTSPATRRRRRFGTIVVPGRGDLYDEMRAKKRQQRDDENVSISIGEPTSSVHPRKRKAAPVKLTAAEMVVARTREQWTSCTSAASVMDDSEQVMVMDVEGNHDQEDGSGTLLSSRVVNVQTPEEDVHMRSSGGHEKKSSGASASTVRLRPAKPYTIARPETADEWRIEAMQMVQSARKYSDHNGYFCRRSGCEELLETVEALAEHLRHHDSIYTPGGPAVKQCGRCGGMYECDRELRMHKCRLGGRSSSPSKRSLLTLPQPVKTQIQKVKNLTQRCVAAVASTRKLAPTSRRYEPY